MRMTGHWSSPTSVLTRYTRGSEPKQGQRPLVRDFDSIPVKDVILPSALIGKVVYGEGQIAASMLPVPLLQAVAQASLAVRVIAVERSTVGARYVELTEAVTIT